MKIINLYKVVITFCCLISSLSALSAHADPMVIRVRIGGAEIEAKVAESYYVQLLHKALVRGAKGREVPVFKFIPFMEQGRAMHELMRGELLDVDWFGTDLERESNLRVIHIPLERGLLSYRQFIIHRDNREKFDEVINLNDLKKYIACQGLNWPDSKILQAAGLRVNELSGFESMFRQVAAKRCDYFPRAYFEADSELEVRQSQYKNLIKYESIILHYPLAVYFFVNKKNEYLAQWIEQGLELMIDNGELLEHMKLQPETAHIFPLVIPKNTVWIEMNNPFLSAGTDYKNSRYWFQAKDFAHAKSH